jgi:hypothetical protein
VAAVLKLARRLSRPVKFDVDGVGFCELIFKDDGAACCVECGAAVNQIRGLAAIRS